MPRHVRNRHLTPLPAPQAPAVVPEQEQARGRLGDMAVFVTLMLGCELANAYFSHKYYSAKPETEAGKKLQASLPDPQFIGIIIGMVATFYMFCMRRQ
jgi:hypothetical protein